MPRRIGTLILLLAACSARDGDAQGIVFPGVGPVNRSMAGAAVAAPLDAAGALYWNPGATAGLAASDIVVGVELHMPQSQLGGSVPAGAFGPGTPAASLEGRAESHSGTRFLPTVALVHQPASSRWTYGLGVLSIGGFDFDYAADPSHPILSRDGYLGSVDSHCNFTQVAPTVAVQLTDHLAVGAGPTLTIAEMGFAPSLLAAPDDADGDGRASYPDASYSPIRYGMGFQAGVYVTTDTRWHLGASVKSKQWLEEFIYRTEDERGDPRTLKVRAEYPMIVSVGAAYSGFPRWLTAVDVRYIAFSDTDLFGEDAVFRADGSLRGFGWRDSISTSLGCQYLWSNSLALRVGYLYGQSPAPSSAVAVNLQTGEFWNHALTMGATVHVASNVSLTTAYVRTFDKTTSGPLWTADNPSAGEVSVAQRSDALTSGISIQF